MPENSLIVPTMDKPATPPHVVPQQYGSGILKTLKKNHLCLVWFWFWEWTPSIERKLGVPRGILPHVQTGLTNWESK